MTDLEQVKAMLDRAGIPHVQEDVGPQHGGPNEKPPLPDGAVGLSIGVRYGHGVPAERQPFAGGYGGFYAEMIFAKDGTLLAVWAWE